MLEAILSKQYQVVIPEEIIDTLNLKAGQKFSVTLKGDLISLIPLSSATRFRGILKGANTENSRDRIDRL